MLSKQWVFLVLTLCLMSTGVSASLMIGDSIKIIPGKSRVIANGSDTALITAQLWNLSNDTNVMTAGVPVTFALADTSYGSLTVINNGRTDGQGLVSVLFRAYKKEGTVNVSATANAKVSAPFTLHLQAPVKTLSLMANPDSMPSLEMEEATPATLYATILEDVGYPVPNQTVTFTLVSYTNTTVLTSRPSFSPTSFVTGADVTTLYDPANSLGMNGVALQTFYPGKFPLAGEPYYCQTASGTATIRAQWSGRSKTTVLTFKNYPSLSVKTSVDPPVVEPGGFFDVHLQLVGDEWGLHSSPINVSLCTDRSGSMQFDNPDRMVSIMAAEKAFVEKMNFPRDFVGIVTFGHKGTKKGYMDDRATLWDSYSQLLGPGIDSSSKDNAAYINASYPGGPQDSTGIHSYSDYAVVDQNLSNSKGNIDDTISRIIPYGGTPLRDGIYKSIEQLNGSSPQTATSVKAIIVLSDGDYNYYGDPLARGSRGSGSDPTWYNDLTKNYWCYSGIDTCPAASTTTTLQNLSNYAKYKNIRIYAIAYGSSISPGGQTALQVLAEGTGGKYFTATATDIVEVYTQIAGELRREASVNTKMGLSFDNLNVTYDSATFSVINGKSLLDYQYNISAPSTWVTSYNKTISPIPDSLVLPSTYENVTWLGSSNHYPYTFDQRRDWQSSGSLDFSVGTISVNQTWETKFRFRVLPGARGTVDIFGPASFISVNNGTTTLSLPHTYVSIVPKTANLTVDIDKENKGITVTDNLTVRWNLNYDGSAPTLVEQVYYTNQPVYLGQWVLFRDTTIASTATSDSAVLDTRLLPQGTYSFRVHATDTEGAEDDDILEGAVNLGTERTAYIKLE